MHRWVDLRATLRPGDLVLGCQQTDDLPVDVTDPAEHLRCGCCGRRLPARRVTQLDSSPGVHICLGCALSAARRVSRLPFPRFHPTDVLHRLRHHRGKGQGPATLVEAIPVFPVTDLDSSIRFYEQLGFGVVERLQDYAALESGGIELHLHQGADRTADVAFVHTSEDPTGLWRQLTERRATGLGPVRDQPWGLREFITTDPDGNTPRIGHPSPC